MERKLLYRLLVLAVLVMALLGLNAYTAVAADTNDDLSPLIAPIRTEPAGQTYGRWAAEWWQWALGVPAAVNPLTDTTGEHCAQRQVDHRGPRRAGGLTLLLFRRVIDLMFYYLILRLITMLLLVIFNNFPEFFIG